jgi:hypothetical protein
MALSPSDAEITSPCPIRLSPDRAAGGVKGWHCGHCDKSVHVLSNMTETQARGFLGARVGQDLCVTYALRQDGSIRFRPEAQPVAAQLVPVSALRRRSAKVAAVGLGLALAACTPHDHPDVDSGVEVAEVTVVDPYVAPSIPDQLDPEMLMDGSIAPVPPPVPGRMRVVPLPEPEGVELPEPEADEPCEPNRELAMRGGIRMYEPGDE